VLALGGGACLGESNRAVLRAHYRTVYLRASLEELRRRVGQGRGRPLWDHEVAARLEARRPRYEEATVVIDTDGRSPEEVARAVLQEVACEG
jgi:shikimate kinase